MYDSTECVNVCVTVITVCLMSAGGAWVHAGVRAMMFGVVFSGAGALPDLLACACNCRFIIPSIVSLSRSPSAKGVGAFINIESVRPHIGD